MEQPRLKGIVPFPSIRTQLLIVSLVVLILPWVGIQTLRDMENLLRQQQVQSVMTSATSILNALSSIDETIMLHNQESELTPAGSEVVLSDFTTPIIVDGYADDWPDDRIKQAYDTTNALQDGNSSSQVSFVLSSVRQQGKLILLLDVNDDVLYQTSNPLSEPHNGDRILLGLADEQARIDRRYVIGSNTPGWLRVIPLHDPSSNETRIQAELQVRSGGYTIEIALPEYLLSRHISLQLIDRDNDDNSDYAVIGNTPVAPATGGLIFGQYPQIMRTINAYRGPGQSISVIDRRGYVLANTTDDTASPDRDPSMKHDMLDRLLQILILADTITGDEEIVPYQMQQDHVQHALHNQPDHLFYRDASGRGFLSVAVPLVIDDLVAGVVVLEQSTDAITGVRYRALVKIMLTTLSAIAVIAVVLLLYATILIKRIRKLNRQLQSIASDDGRLQQALDRSVLGDEIGELNRGIASLIVRLQAYQQYLETMASKLSHELRTPLSVVQSSLENLQHDNAAFASHPLVDRANDGLERLKTILSNLTEASRLESALKTTEPENFDLCMVVQGCVDGYQQVYPDVTFQLHNDIGQYDLTGSADLIAQMLDKLVSNAVDFHTLHTPIRITIVPSGKNCQLCVENEGQTIAADVINTLFDSMVSARNTRDETPHMGLGLYIVRLIAQFHNGTASITSKDGTTSVCVVFGRR